MSTRPDGTVISSLSVAMSAAVFLMAILALLALDGAQRLFAELERGAGLLVEVSEGAGPGSLTRLTGRLEAMAGVASVRPLPGSALAADLRDSIDERVLQELGHLPDMIEVVPARGVAPTDLAGAIEGLPSVAMVVTPGRGAGGLLRDLARLIERVGWAVVVLSWLLALWLTTAISWALAGERRDEISLRRLMGASELSIRRPSMVRGAMVNLAGVVLAYTFMLGLVGMARSILGPNAAMFGLTIEPVGLTPSLVMACLAGVTGALGGYLGAGRVG